MAQAIRTAIRLTGLIAVMSSLAAPADADKLQDVIAAARIFRHGGVPAFAGLSESHPSAHLWSVTTFYVRWRREGEERGARRAPIWEAQRISGRGDAEPKTEWLSSETCPALSDRLARLRGLRAPVLQVPGLEPRSDTIPVTLEGVDYRLWTRFARYPDGGEVGELELAAKPPSPLAEWADETRRSLASCWRETEPGA